MANGDVQATRDKLAADLRALGLRAGGVLLVHSSLSALGWVPGGPETVIQALLAALAPEGTLLLPGLSWELVNETQPYFDVRTTGTCVGAIPEHFRTRPGTLRSAHPSHSICGVGPLAAELFASHELDRTPVGEHSPLRRLPELGAQVLFLGCGLRTNTTVHGVEELVEPPYLFQPYTVTYHLTLADGSTMTAEHRVHKFGEWDCRYERLESMLARGTELRSGPTLQGRSYLLEARAMCDVALAALRRDPYALVGRRDGC